jgi:putative membrane protein insertion efficiency factor
MNLRRRSLPPWMLSASQVCGHGATVSLVALIRFYQRCISPALGPRCRFYPSCSQYCVESVRLHGLARGLLRSGLRLCKCHPFHPGGIDLP